MAPFHPTSHHVGFQSRWMNQGLLISMLDNVPANPALRIYGCNMQQYLDLKPCCRLRPLKTSALIILCPVKIAIFGVPCSIQSWQAGKSPISMEVFMGNSSIVYVGGLSLPSPSQRVQQTMFDYRKLSPIFGPTHFDLTLSPTLSHRHRRGTLERRRR